MPPPVKPHPRRSNPHIRLNSNSVDLVIPDFTDDHPPAPPPKKRIRQARPLQREPNSRKSLYSIEGTSIEHLLPPRPTLVKGPSVKTPPRTKVKSSPVTPGSRAEDAGHVEHDPLGAARPLRNTIFRAPSQSSSYPTSLNTQTVTDKFDILPSSAFILYPEDVEVDDELHNPDAHEKHPGCDVFSVRGCVNITGLVFITLGLLILFIGYPVL